MLRRTRDFRRFWLLIALLTAAPAGAQPPTATDAEAVRVSKRVATALMQRLSVARHRGMQRQSRCLDALLTQANSLRAQAAEHTQQLRAAVRRNERDGAQRQRELLSRLSERARTLDRMATACQPERVVTHTRVTSTIPLAPRHEPAPL